MQVLSDRAQPEDRCDIRGHLAQPFVTPKVPSHLIKNLGVHGPPLALQPIRTLSNPNSAANEQYSTSASVLVITCDSGLRRALGAVLR